MTPEEWGIKYPNKLLLDPFKFAEQYADYNHKEKMNRIPDLDFTEIKQMDEKMFEEYIFNAFKT